MRNGLLASLALVALSAACRKPLHDAAQTAPPSSSDASAARSIDAGAATSRPSTDLAYDADAFGIVRQFCSYLRTTATDYAGSRVGPALRASCEKELFALVADKSIAVSRAAWARCDAHLRTREGPLDHGIRDAFQCADLFVGLLAENARCEHALTCSAGLYCDDLTTHACVPRLAEGARCTKTLMGNPCMPGLRCEANVCRRLPKRGEECRGHCDGANFCIEHVCREALGQLGESCQPGVDGCSAGLRCTLRQKCEPRLPAGAQCAGHDDCASGACVTPPRSGPTTCH
jgi:hypothetical protein